MSRFVIILAIAAIAYLIWFKIKKAKGEEKKKLIIWSIAGSVIVVLGFLAITGRLNFITAAITGAVALLPKAAQLLRYLPILNKVRQQASNSNQQQSNQQSPSQTAMNHKQACDILGIPPDATKEEIIKAHKRMMQKVHPDRGGSDYLAAQINQAKDTLLG
ncbi:MAG: DnaJ domain-containing protein [Gammaproteobacteria bacterium]|nr:DnaJ domain-containing protein [Gammaproteobacteria bacterium]